MFIESPDRLLKLGQIYSYNQEFHLPSVLHLASCSTSGPSWSQILILLLMSHIEVLMSKPTIILTPPAISTSIVGQDVEVVSIIDASVNIASMSSLVKFRGLLESQQNLMSIASIKLLGRSSSRLTSVHVIYSVVVLMKISMNLLNLEIDSLYMKILVYYDQVLLHMLSTCQSAKYPPRNGDYYPTVTIGDFADRSESSQCKWC